jgi:hypothetical protein
VSLNYGKEAEELRIDFTYLSSAEKQEKANMRKLKIDVVKNKKDQHLPERTFVAA